MAERDSRILVVKCEGRFLAQPLAERGYRTLEMKHEGHILVVKHEGQILA